MNNINSRNSKLSSGRHNNPINDNSNSAHIDEKLRSAQQVNNKNTRGSLRMQSNQQSIPGLANSETILDQINLGAEAKHDALVAQEESNERMRVSRKFARPVEIIMNLCESGKEADLRSILGITSSQVLDEISLKKAYRSISLSIHPGNVLTYRYCFD